jgi:hypothetical protein
MFPDLGDFLPIQHREQISKPRKSHKELKSGTASEQVAGGGHRCDHPGLRVPPMVDDFLSLIHNSELRRSVARLVECVLIASIHSHMAQCHFGNFLQLPTHGTVDAAHDDRKVLGARLFGERAA